MTHPQLLSVTASATAGEYEVRLGDADGSELVWTATIVGLPVCDALGASFDPGPILNEPWGGDAESIRSIVSAVVAVHRARHYGR